MLAVLLVALTWAQDPQSLDVLQTARLNESAYGNHEDAIRGYTSMVRSLAADDPMRAIALYRLAAARYAMGDSEKAREPLMEANRTGVCYADCQILLGRIDLEHGSVRKIPVIWDFSSTNHGLHHPWQFEDKGGIRVESPAEAANPALIWRTIVDANKLDQLVIGFERPQPAPRKISFRIQAGERAASIRVRLVDDMGRNYGPAQGPIRVRADRPTKIELPLRQLVPADPADGPLDPATLSRMFIEDISVFSGTPPGEHALYFDDFAIE